MICAGCDKDFAVTYELFGGVYCVDCAKDVFKKPPALVVEGEDA